MFSGDATGGSRRRHFIKNWRRYRKLTQEQLAERIGAAPSGLSQLETGKQGYSPETLDALAKALDCQPGDLLSHDPAADAELLTMWRSFTEAEKSMALAILRLHFQRAS